MNRKKLLSLVIVTVIVCSFAVIYAAFFMTPAQTHLTPNSELDLTVSGSSNCLRFLNISVPTVYIPFTVAANENWLLTVNCTKMPGGANGWTDVYIYRGYWDKGTNHTCTAGDIYPIIADIENTGFSIFLDRPFTQTFGDSTQQSYTVFFVLPPGGPSAFHVTYKPA
jgi:hypothetical protein